MYQVTFSNQSMNELNKLGIREQLWLIDQICKVTPEQLKQPHEPLGHFSRNGTEFYRLRAGEYRIYFEIQGDTLSTHSILHKNTLTDFIFRSKLPISEEQMLEQHQSFWRYLETLRREH